MTGSKTVETSDATIPDLSKAPWDRLFDCRFEWQALDDKDDCLLHGLKPEWTDAWQRKHANQGHTPTPDADDFADQREHPVDSFD